MGRTVPTWRRRIEQRLGTWSGFGRVLRRRERRAFERLQHAVREHADAGSMLPAPDEFEPLLLCILLEALRAARDGSIAGIRLHEVSREVNNARNDGAHLIARA